MKNPMTISFSFLFITLTALFLSPVVLAQYGQYGSYGYGNATTQSILIDKMVGINAITKGGVTATSYVDNLSPSDPRFHAGDQISFQLKVKNTSNTAFSDVTVKDIVPPYLTPVAGPGSFDAGSQTVTFDVGSLNPDEEKMFYLTMQVVSTDKLPTDRNLICELNKAQVSTSNATDSDTSQFCIEKQVVGVTAVPQAGPEFGALLLTGELITLSAGVYLKKRFGV